MSITSADDRRTRYNPVVATTSFAADFPVFDNDDLKVFVDGVERDDFSVSATYVEGISNDATAVFAVGITGVVDVVGWREPKRTNRFLNGAPLPTRDFNLALDTAQAEVQEVRRDVDRAAKSPLGSVGYEFDADLADGDTLMKSGDRLVPGPNAAEIQAAEGYAEAAALSAAAAADDAVATDQIRDDVVEIASSIVIRRVAGRTALKALSSLIVRKAWLEEGGRSGWFSIHTSGYDDEIADDPQEGMYIRLTDGGAAVRQYDGAFMASWFDGIGAGNKLAGLQAALRASAGPHNPTLSEGVAELVIDGDVSVGGGVKARDSATVILDSNSKISGAPGAVVDIAGWSNMGSSVTNVDPTIGDDSSEKQHITVEDLIFDATNYPAPFEFTLEADGTTTSVTLPAAADGAFAGLRFQVLDGPAAGQTGSIASYNSGTKVITFAAITAAPLTGNKIRIGWNDNIMGFAGSVDKVRVSRVVFRNLDADKMVATVQGGKGFTNEYGGNDIIVRDCVFDGLPGGLFAQGLPGTNANGSLKKSTSIQYLNNYAKRCGYAAMFAGIDADAVPPGDLSSADANMHLLDGLFYEDCGHQVHRFVVVYQAKSGIIVLGEAKNVIIKNVMGKNALTYPDTDPGYPTDYPARVGYGLFGVVGAMLHGYGRNIQLDTWHHFGNVGACINISRARAAGEDAGGTQAGVPSRVIGWDVRNMHLHGSCEYIIRIDEYAPFRVPAAQMFGSYFHITVDAATLGLVDPNMSAFEDVTLELIERNTNKRVIGSPAQIIAAGNTFASFTKKHTDLRETAFKNGISLGGGGPIISVLSATLGHDFGTVAAHAEATVTVAVPGAVTGSRVWVDVSYTGTRVPGLIYTGQVTAADTVTIMCTNTTAGNLASGNRTYSVKVSRMTA